MPELPEVETTKNGLWPHLRGRHLVRVDVRERRLRWPIPEEVGEIQLEKIHGLERRAKYLLLSLEKRTLLIHLGMSGSFRVLDESATIEKHDHYDLVLDDGVVIRYRDPRRFGSLLLTDGEPMNHHLLAKLGPEPLDGAFNSAYLHQRVQNRKVAIKTFIMNQSVVVGVGNIYACEALFDARIDPQMPSSQLTKEKSDALVESIKSRLKAAIAQGGTTLKDFAAADGTPGYFAQSLFVYGRDGQDCLSCDTPIEKTVLGQRSTFFCPTCQH